MKKENVMASRKPSTVAAAKAQPTKKPAAKKSVTSLLPAGAALADLTDKAESGDLIAENLVAMTQLIRSLTETVEVLVQKAESMAYHIIASEEIIAELVAANGLNLARVNARIRAKVESEPDPVDSVRAIDVAAAIASPLPRR